MSKDYSITAATALRLLTKFGQVGSIRRVTLSGGGPASVTAATAASLDYEAVIAVLPMPSASVGQNIGDTVIRQTDVMIYANADVAIVPVNNDRVVTALGTYTILRCNALAPSGVTVLYDIVGRL